MDHCESSVISGAKYRRNNIVGLVATRQWQIIGPLIDERGAKCRNEPGYKFRGIHPVHEKCYFAHCARTQFLGLTRTRTCSAWLNEAASRSKISAQNFSVPTALIVILFSSFEEV